MSNEEGKNRTGVSHRPYDEAFKRAAVAQWQSGVPASRVAEGLGITAESLRTWRRQLGGTATALTTVAAGKLPTVAPSAQELAAEVRLHRALRRAAQRSAGRRTGRLDKGKTWRPSRRWQEQLHAMAFKTSMAGATK